VVEYGACKPKLIDAMVELAEGGVGLIITGHRGKSVIVVGQMPGTFSFFVKLARASYLTLNRCCRGTSAGHLDTSLRDLCLSNIIHVSGGRS
jgi:hypothetical protein